MDTTRDLVAIDPIRGLEAMESRTFGQRFLRLNPEFTLFRKGFGLCLQLVHRLGDEKPRDELDGCLRDLSCDILDSLWTAERSLLRGYENQALVLLRRAYEATSLMAYFLNFPEEVKAWEKGKVIPHWRIRKALDTAPLPESKENLQTEYAIYSLFSHVNRETVYHRLLGDGNHMTLGAQGNVSEEIVSAVTRELLRLMMWFVDVFNYAFAYIGEEMSKGYRQAAIDYREEVQNSANRLPNLFGKRQSESTESKE